MHGQKNIKKENNTTFFSYRRDNKVTWIFINGELVEIATEKMINPYPANVENRVSS
jgi:hypothetical protein